MKKKLILLLISAAIIGSLLVALILVGKSIDTTSNNFIKTTYSTTRSSTATNILTGYPQDEIDYEILGKKIHLTDLNFYMAPVDMVDCYTYSDEHARGYYFEKSTGKLLTIHSNSSYDKKKVYNDKQMEDLAKRFIKEQLPDVDLSKYVSELNWTTSPGIAYSIIYKKAVQGYHSADGILVTVLCDGSVDSYIAGNIGRFDNLPKIDEEALKKKMPAKYKGEYSEYDYEIDKDKKPYIGLSLNGKPALIFYITTFYSEKDGGGPAEHLQLPVEIQ